MARPEWKWWKILWVHDYLGVSVCAVPVLHLCVCLDVMRWVCAYGYGLFLSLSMGAAEGKPEVMCAVGLSGRGQAVLRANEFISSGIPSGPVLLEEQTAKSPEMGVMLSFNPGGPNIPSGLERPCQPLLRLRLGALTDATISHPLGTTWSQV